MKSRKAFVIILVVAAFTLLGAWAIPHLPQKVVAELKSDLVITQQVGGLHTAEGSPAGGRTWEDQVRRLKQAGRAYPQIILWLLRYFAYVFAALLVAYIITKKHRELSDEQRRKGIRVIRWLAIASLISWLLVAPFVDSNINGIFRFVNNESDGLALGAASLP